MTKENENEKIKFIIHKLNYLENNINNINNANFNKVLKPKQTPKVIKAKLYLKKYNIYKLFYSNE